MNRCCGDAARVIRTSATWGRAAPGIVVSVPAVAALVVALVPCATAWGQPTSAPRRVLLVSCDGLRPDAIERAEAPVMQRLIATGSYQATCLDEIPPVTLPNHISMVTGLGVATHRVIANTTLPGRVEATTIFDRATAAGLGVGFFVGKGKLAFLCEEGSVDVWRLAADTDELVTEVAATVASMDLHLVFVHFAATDGAGHRDGWMSNGYLATVASVDAAIGRILDALDARGVLDETVVIVTADHGGHAHTHFLDIPEDRFIPFILNGPGIAAGRLLCEQVRVMDAAATVLDVLGLPTDSAADGRVVTEASIDFAQPPCTAPDVQFGGLCGTLSFLLALSMVGLLGRRSLRWEWRTHGPRRS